MKALTPYEVALRMMGNGRDAGLIAAYLAEEARRAGHDDPMRFSPYIPDRVHYAWGDIKASCSLLRVALTEFSRALPAAEKAALDAGAYR